MSFWTWLTGQPSGNTDSPGDPEGVEVNIHPAETRGLPAILPSPWAGWPADWAVPRWDFGSRYNELVDVAWGCLDLNSRVLSSMPVYRTRNGRTVEADTWMTNPDPDVYSSWAEFAKQLFWDFQLGEAFILPMAYYSDGWPMRFRVVPPWVVDVRLEGGRRTYRLGQTRDVTDEILHIRYKSTTADPRGVGPLESAGGRMVTAGVLAKYIRETVSIGGVIAQTLETDKELSPEDAQQTLEDWVATRSRNLSYPPVLDNSLSLKTHKPMSPRDMAMIEVAQFTEGRIADLLGVPRALMGLPTGDSFTYSNVSSWFDHHDRSTLKPAATHVMTALSNWALPIGESAELNRDEYSRPPLRERAEAYKILNEIDVLSEGEIRAMERFDGLAAAVTGSAGLATDERAGSTPQEIAEMIQKIYLGVGVVLSAKEARDILNRAGAGLNGLPALVPQSGGELP